MHPNQLVAVIMLAAASVFAGCAHDASPKAPAAGAPPVVTFITKDHVFEGPDTLPAGITTVQMVNQGSDLHHVTFLKLEDGKSIEDLSGQYPGATSLLPAWVKAMGGPNAVLPGEQTDATVLLEPGQYVLTCEIPDRQMTPHVVHGMRKSLRVTGSPASTELPQPAVEVRLIDFGFAPSAPIKPGKQTIRVSNHGSQAHELVLVQLQPGASSKDFVAAFEPGASGPPPGKPLGGLSPIAKGGTGTFTADLPPGTYGLICFQVDPASGQPHFMKGMMTDFTVE